MIEESLDDLAPLQIKCTDSDCEAELHCFKSARGMKKEDKGRCRSCGVDLVDWPRVHQRNVDDAEHTFGMLQLELIRHHFFHAVIDERAVRHAKRKGRKGLSEAIHTRLEKYLAPANFVRDGRQTPFEGNVIYYAQHATATCCRACLDYWHGIPKGRPMFPDELDYCQALIEQFIDLRLPDLQLLGVKVPPLRKRSGR
jgi:hypothetical protein